MTKPNNTPPRPGNGVRPPPKPNPSVLLPEAVELVEESKQAFLMAAEDRALLAGRSEILTATDLDFVVTISEAVMPEFLAFRRAEAFVELAETSDHRWKSTVALLRSNLAEAGSGKTDDEIIKATAHEAWLRFYDGTKQHHPSRNGLSGVRLLKEHIEGRIRSFHRSGKVSGEHGTFNPTAIDTGDARKFIPFYLGALYGVVHEGLVLADAEAAYLCSIGEDCSAAERAMKALRDTHALRLDFSSHGNGDDMSIPRMLMEHARTTLRLAVEMRAGLEELTGGPVRLGWLGDTLAAGMLAAIGLASVVSYMATWGLEAAVEGTNARPPIG